jgi:hypothetical protein
LNRQGEIQKIAEQKGNWLGPGQVETFKTLARWIEEMEERVDDLERQLREAGN